MVINITTWSPDTCGCQFSYSWDSEVPQDKRVHTFYVVHNVCAHHAHLATKSFANESHSNSHKAASESKMKHIHSAMEQNVANHQNLINKTTRRLTRRDLEALTPQIHQFNQRVKENFEDIFSEPYAHDEHIYKAVLAENQHKNITIAKIHEQFPGEPVDFEFDNARNLILKVAPDKAKSLQHLSNDRVKVTTK